ncbi:hypothetical protein RKD56_000984 [Priestia megaterium]
MEEIPYEEIFKQTLLEYLSIKGESELQQMLSQSKILIHEKWGFSGKRNNQRSAIVEIKVPVTYKEIIESKYIEILDEICGDLYEDDDSYGYTGVQIGVVLLSTVKTVNHVSKEVSYLKNHANYQNLMDKVSKMDISKDDKLYIYEACNSAISGNNIAAMTMLGCATELLVIQFGEAYKNYLIREGKEGEAKKFTEKVINARSAYTRVDEFSKRVEGNKDIFKNMGFENPTLQFNFIDIIRQVRNESGHPTGKKISNEDLSTMFGNFQFLVENIYGFINENKEEELNF